MKLIFLAVALAMSPESQTEEVELKIPTHLVSMCQAEGGCALVTKQAVSELSIRMFKAGVDSVKKGCGA